MHPDSRGHFEDGRTQFLRRVRNDFHFGAHAQFVRLKRAEPAT